MALVDCVLFWWQFTYAPTNLPQVRCSSEQGVWLKLTKGRKKEGEWKTKIKKEKKGEKWPTRSAHKSRGGGRNLTLKKSLALLKRPPSDIADTRKQTSERRKKKRNEETDDLRWMPKVYWYLGTTSPTLVLCRGCATSYFDRSVSISDRVVPSLKRDVGNYTRLLIL